MLKWPPKKRELSERANSLELFDFVCHVCCVSWWKLELLKVKIDVCVRYNRIFAYCILRTDPLRTAYRLNTPWILRTKKGGVTFKYGFNILLVELHVTQTSAYWHLWHTDKDKSLCCQPQNWGLTKGKIYMSTSMSPK